MTSGRSDAATSTEDDAEAQPLCLFYFTHPFGVLSPRAPLASPAPPHLARAFGLLDMQRASPAPGPAPGPLWTPSTDDYNSSATSTTNTSRPEYELGDATIYKKPVNLVSISRARKYTLDVDLRRDSLSSSLFSGDFWFTSSSSTKSFDYSQRIIPYSKMLPPLRLPVAKILADMDYDYWPDTAINSGKLSLPPIEKSTSCGVNIQSSFETGEVSSVSMVSEHERRGGRGGRGVGKRARRGGRARHGPDLRRVLALMICRTIKGGADVLGAAPASPRGRLRRALRVLRDAWPSPPPPLVPSTMLRGVVGGTWTADRGSTHSDAMATRAHPPAPRDSSPGLLHRRYSVPETIMRKYSLAQQQSELAAKHSGSSASASASPARGPCSSPSESPRREYLRRATLLRRARACCARETRSLDNSRCELRNLSSSLTSSRYSNIGAGWLSPKRQRLETPHDIQGSDEILRIAMKNCYERSEESRNGKTSDCTYNSHNQQVSPYTSTDVLIDSYISESGCRSKRDVFAKYSELYSDSNEMPLKIDFLQPVLVDSKASTLLASTDDPSFTDTSDTFSTSMPTTKEIMDSRGHNRLKNISKSNHIAGRISERETSAENDAYNIVPYDKLVAVNTPSYEVLEVIVSETFNNNAPSLPHLNKTTDSQTTSPNINMRNRDIDEYVSNILLESLNSLTDQLEHMNASIGPDNKISILEKEIKVKLHNTGVNTIVHLSPTSNNQIIFGNKELCNNEELIKIDECDKTGNVYVNIDNGKKTPVVETDNDFASVVTHNDHSSICNSNSYHLETKNSQCDNVNKVVLQKIQKLFQDKFFNSNPVSKISSISHLSSDVDVFIENNRDFGSGETEGIEMQTNSYTNGNDILGGIKTGNYYQHFDNNAIVPRFSALPTTDSMEVNTSSSEDVELINSECTSLVDSLDDPNSPRSVFKRQSLGNLNRSELVRSSIDILDLLPESINSSNEEKLKREKGESFFIRINDKQDECDKENLKVADRMPDKIKQRLFCRHRKRELRMECARRSKTKLLKRAVEKQKYNYLYKASKDIEKECMAIINELIEDLISKIISEEYKYITIKNKGKKLNTTELHEYYSKKLWKKDIGVSTSREKRSSKYMNTNEPKPVYINESSRRLENNQNEKYKSQAHSSIGLAYEIGPKRIYQKSEIFDGSKCVEILEILEYVEKSHSSPETTNSDESQNQYLKVRKSRIPIPVLERAAKNFSIGHERSASILRHEGIGYSYPNNNLKEKHGDDNYSDNNCNYVRSINGDSELPHRRASVPHLEARVRSNSLRFRRVFDIIPEEKSSISVESSNEDINYNRRVSAPNLSKDFCIKHNKSDNLASILKRGIVSNITTDRKVKDSSDATSPTTKVPCEIKNQKLKCTNKTTMTSPKSKSAATSPASPVRRVGEGAGAGGARRGLAARGRAWLGFCHPTPPQPSLPPSPSPDNEGFKEFFKAKFGNTDSNKQREWKSTSSQCEGGGAGESRGAGADAGSHRERTVRTIQSDIVEHIIVGSERARARPDPDPGAVSEKKRTRSRSMVDKGRAANRSTNEPQTTEVVIKKPDKQKVRKISVEKNEDESIRRRRRVPEYRESEPERSSSEDEWKGVRGRARGPGARGWSVTVAGSCRAALPSDVEMRLRFAGAPLVTTPTSRAHAAHRQYANVDMLTGGESMAAHASCQCQHRGCPTGEPAPPLRCPPAPALTLQLKKEAIDSSIVTSKSSRKAKDFLPDLETYRASKSKTKSSLKTHRGSFLHCWLPEDQPDNISEHGLSVLGSAIVPELKPRVRTMTERDVTRHHPAPPPPHLRAASLHRPLHYP